MKKSSVNIIEKFTERQL